MKIAIVEDEESAAKSLEDILHRFFQENGLTLELSVYLDERNLLDSFRPNLYDVIFMDIEMPHINGLSLAAQLRKQDSDFILVFVTNLAQMAIKGYEVNAFDFIVKPIDYSSFSMKMKRVLRALHTRDSKDLVLTVPTGIIRLASEEIEYVEVRGHKLTYHTAEESITVRGSMVELEKTLSGKGFSRCNNCYLVNLAHVVKVLGNEVYVGNVPLLISRPRRKVFLQSLTDYLGGSMV